MKDSSKTKQALTEELVLMRQRIGDLEQADVERKRAEEVLRESEKRYRFITEKMTDIVWIQDMNLRTVYVSPSIKSLLGFTPEERVAQDVHEQLTPASMSVVLDVMAKELALEQQVECDPNRKITLELEYYHKDGSTRWIENILSGIRDDRGTLTGIHGVSRDITERKRAQEALRENRDRLQQVTSLILDIVYSCITDEEGNFSINWMSGAAKRISGYSIEEIMSQKCWRSLVIEEDLALFEKNVTDLIPGSDGMCELRIQRKDGGIVWIASYAKCVRESVIPGRIRLYGALIDITEHKLAEEALKKSEEELRRLIETLPLAVFVETQGKIVYANPAFVTLFKASSPDEVIGMRLTEFAAPEMFDILEKGRRSMNGDNPILSPLELNLRCMDGTGITVVATPMPMIFQEQPSILAALYDITERKRSEIELQKAHQLLRIHVRKIEDLQDRMKEMATRDVLTGLFNRRYLDETLERELARASRAGFPIGVVMIDIDHFKQVNDVHGHKVGDLTLQALGNLLLSQIRAEDIACRYGGDEFLLILPQASKEITAERAEQLRTGIEALRVAGGEKTLQATISLGVAVYPADGVTTDAVIHAADKAMYRAKIMGGNRVVLS